MEHAGKKILVATNNKNKIPEIAITLDRDGWEYFTLDSLGITEIPEETGTSYEENARIKATAPHISTAMAVLADDSGLEVDALGGAPGIHSARYAGEGANDARNIEKLLDELKDVPEGERTARFVCHIIYIDEEGKELSVQGVCEGRIGFEPQGNKGFGYDPVFFPDEINDGRTMAELSPAEKDAISHRGKALRALRERLITHIAAFDFDGTVLEGHSPVRLVRRLTVRGIIPYRTALKTAWWGVRYKARMKVEQERVREYLFGSFSHMPVEQADKMMSDFYYDDLQQRLRPQALAALKEQRQKGEVIVLVSASFLPILKEVAQDVQADWFICTQMQIEDGAYTGTVEGLPPEGEQKLVQLTAWADERFGKDTWELSVAYGDHHSDETLLAAAKRAIAVNPDTILERAAKRRGWEIVDWSFEPDRTD
jgi:XTP/dITP diphosphohydrolase